MNMTHTNWYVDYDQVAQTYDARYERNNYAGVEQAVRQFVGAHTGMHILEVGCGTGHWLKLLHETGNYVTGLDFSAQMLAKAQASLPRMDLIRARANDMPHAAESFDRVFCINAIHHFADKRAFLAEVRRVLRSGGKMLTVGLDPHNGTDQWHVYDYFQGSLEIDRQRYPPARALREWMKSVGFEAATTQEVEHWNYRIPAREALEQGRLDKAATSQLGVLTATEYQQGIQRIYADIEHAEENGNTLFLTADLRLYGTTGLVGEQS